MGVVKEVVLNVAQLMVAFAIKTGRKYIFLEWGRGTGKSTILGFLIKELCKQMPRATFTLVGETYMQILAVTLKSAKEGLEMFGIYEDVDYVVGRSGRKNGFVMPFQRPDKWNNIIHFSNGCIIQLVSLDKGNSGRGLNSYAEIGDEAALLDPERLFINVKTTNRAKKAQFKNATLLNAQIYMSSTPLTKKGQWFTDMEDKAKEFPKTYAYIRANAYANKANLADDYFQKMRAEAPTALYYRAEILNIRPKEIADGFYSQLNSEKHYYRDYESQGVKNMKASTKGINRSCLFDNDLDTNRPLVLSLDFGVFNSLSVHQVRSELKEHRILKSFWVNSPKILSDLILEQFVPYYHHHKNKRILLYYGHDGNNRLVNSKKTYAQEVEELLKENGWRVKRMTKGAAPTHFDKYLVLNRILKENNPSLPKIRINELNNQDLIVSMENASVLDGGTKELHKDKSSERSKVIKQQHATHLSDTVDIPIYDMYYQEALKSLKHREYMGISTS